MCLLGNYSLVSPARALLDPSCNRIQSSGDLDNPGWLELLLMAASRKVVEYCHRPFALKSWREVLSSTNNTQSFLTVTPIYEIDSLTVTNADGTDTVYNGDNFIFDRDSGQVRFKPTSSNTGNYFPPTGFDFYYDLLQGVYNTPSNQNFLNMNWVYTGGYLDIPEDVQEATIQIALIMAGQASTENDLALGREPKSIYKFGFREEATQFGLFTMVCRNLLERYRSMGMGVLDIVEEVIGPQGPSGPISFRGPQGWQGTIGSQGYTGGQGVQGVLGAQGGQGRQGWQGWQGGQGAQGAQGVQGIEGAQGRQGWQGRVGVQGTQGSQGGQGAQGAGVQGSQGIQGAMGAQGAQGPT